MAKRVYVARWRLVYCTTHGMSHAARDGWKAALCGHPIVREGGKLMGTISPADVDCLTCQRALLRTLPALARGPKRSTGGQT